VRRKICKNVKYIVKIRKDYRRYATLQSPENIPSKWVGKAITMRGAAEHITRAIMVSTKRRAMDLNWFRSSLICLYVQVTVHVHPWMIRGTRAYGCCNMSS